MRPSLPSGFLVVVLVPRPFVLGFSLYWFEDEGTKYEGERNKSLRRCAGEIKIPWMQFDHEKLNVHQAELEFVTWVTPLPAEVSHPHGRRVAEACDQLDRASLLALLNTAEDTGDVSVPHAPSFSTMRGVRRPNAPHDWTHWWLSKHAKLWNGSNQERTSCCA